MTKLRTTFTLGSLPKLIVLISVFIGFHSWSGMAQKDPTGVGSVIGKWCNVTCNNNIKLRLICRKGKQWCVSAMSMAMKGDRCGCCPVPVPSPIAMPITPPVLPPVLPPVFDPTICGKKAFDCRDPIFCDRQDMEPPPGYAPRCLCDLDIFGKSVCWQNMYCDRLLQSQVCSADVKCPTGFSCVQGAECCNPASDRAYCVMECKNPGPPYVLATSNMKICEPQAASLFC